MVTKNDYVANAIAIKSPGQYVN